VVHRKDDRAHVGHRRPRSLDQHEAAAIPSIALELGDEKVGSVVLDHLQCLVTRSGLADYSDADPPQDLLDRIDPHRVGVTNDTGLLARTVHERAAFRSCGKETR
jgi:hypothetical protein